MTTSEGVTIKEEVTPEEDDYILIEDEIKVEETCLQDCEDSACNRTVSIYQCHPPSVIVEQKFSICSMCKCAFERKGSVKLRTESDFYKCNKCILHSRLNHVFNLNPLKNNGRKGQPPTETNWKKKHKSIVQGGPPATDNIKMHHQMVEEDPDSDDDDVVIVEDMSNEVAKSESVLIKKVMFLCLTCKKPFERNKPIKLRDESDWYRCNKCILHSRLSRVFSGNTAGKGAQNSPK